MQAQTRGLRPYEVQVNLVVMHVVGNVLNGLVRLWMNGRLSEMCGGHSPDGGPLIKAMVVVMNEGWEAIGHF